METGIIISIFSEITIQPPTVPAIITFVLSLLLLIISALISASEVAFFSFDAKTLSELEASENKTDRKIIHLLDHPQRLLSTILVGKTFISITIIILMAYASNSIFNFSVVPTWGFVLQVMIISFILVIFGEVIPKIYATQFARKAATQTVPFISAIERIFGPFVSILVNSTSIVNTRLARHNRSHISVDELTHVLEMNPENNEEDKEMLEGIIKFGNIHVVDIMTSRVDIVDVDIKTSYKQLLELIIKCGYSRIPVFAGTRDNIKGILYGKDLLPHLDKPTNFRWQSLVRPAYYIPETKKIDDLLNEFQTNKVHLAIVVDEYGGTSGLVTLEDILEEIVGDISDEYDDEERLFTKLDNHTFLFEAKIQLNDFFKIDEISETDFAKISGEVETLAGLILELKGEIPSKNERIDYGRYVFEIMSVDNRRIKKVKLYIKDDFRKNEE
ncbi:MAG: gliding motility-associated protein GldE [Bacteroidetes bacterium]|nr:gliding motility-associated protein GldE [Bacteroidota bacterium]